MHHAGLSLFLKSVPIPMYIGIGRSLKSQIGNLKFEISDLKSRI
jgi:hypothetical protein